MKPNAAPLLLLLLLTCGCKAPVMSTLAKPTATTSTNTLSAKIDAAAKAADAGLEAARKQASVASASVAAAAAENTNQPPSQRTTFIGLELSVASTNLPPPDAEAALRSEQRRVATLATNLAEMGRLYGEAGETSKRLRNELETAKAAQGEAVKALLAAERKLADDLETNRVENQRRLDTARAETAAAQEAVKRAKDAAYKEREKLLFRALVGLGTLCIVGGIGLAVATSGASAVKSGIAVGCGAACFGLAKVISHPWFVTVFATVCVLAVAGAAFWLWAERRQSIEAGALRRVVAATEQHHLVRDDKGELTAFGNDLSRTMDDAHKSAVARARRRLSLAKARRPA